MEYLKDQFWVLLFILYSNDLSRCLTHSKAILFADDTTLYILGTSIPEICLKMNSDLDTLSDWFRANKLSANSSKTKYMLFSKKGVLPGYNTILEMNGHILDQVQSTKFLGLHVDRHFTWDVQIECCRKKIAQGMYAMHMSKHILQQHHLKILYHSLVHSHLSYGILLWGNTYQKYLNKLEIAQKKCIRIIAGAAYNATTLTLFKKLNILKFKDMYQLILGQFMFNFVRKDLPDPLQKIFKFHGDNHDHNTRHRTDPIAPNLNTEIMRKCYLYTGPNMWISLSESLKSSKNKRQFKTRMKQSLNSDH